MTRSGKSCGGRPLGLMSHWLHNCGQKRQGEHVFAPMPIAEQRRAARKQLMELPGALALASLEAHRKAGAGDEPDEVW